MIKRLLLTLTLLVAPVVFAPSAFAVDVFGKDVCVDATNTSAVCQDGTAGEKTNPLFGSQGILTMIINLLSAVVAIVAIIIIVLAGLKFVTSGTNPQDVSNARERIIYACVALVIAGIAQVLVRFVLERIIPN